MTVKDHIRSLHIFDMFVLVRTQHDHFRSLVKNFVEMHCVEIASRHQIIVLNECVDYCS